MPQPLYVYKASAGAGKTFALTVEYVLLLLRQGAGAFRNTLAVTFTNKATAEMKERILDTLYGIARSLPEAGKYLEAVSRRLDETGDGMGEAMIRKRAAEALTAILHDYSHFRVETIDSFFQSVLRNLAHELGLTANLQVELNNDEVVSRAVDRVIENMQDDRDVQEWILEYVEEQMSNGDRWNVTDMVKRFARCIYEEAFQNRTEAERRKLASSAEVRSFKAEMYAVIAGGKKLLCEQADRWEKLVDESEANFSVISYASRYRSFLAAVRGDRYDDPSATVLNACDDHLSLLRKPDRRDAALAASAQAVSYALAELVEIYMREKRRIVTARLCLRYLNPIRLLSSIEKEANDINAENNQFMLSRTPSLLGRLVEGTDAPFVFEKSGTQLRNVMIDEFQDTSRQQWNNFRVLLLENQAGGGSDLLVGDVKQSIYRWRNGDWEILDNVTVELKGLAPQERRLTHNFRSRKRVIDFNNAFFPRAAAALDSLAPEARFSIAGIYGDVTQQTPRTDETGYVRAMLYEKDGAQAPADYEERMAADMVAHIRSMTAAGLRAGDFAILIRNNRYIPRLLYWFARLAPEIQLVSDEAFLLEAGVSVCIIVAALHCITDRDGTDPIPVRYLMMHYMQDVEHRRVTMRQVTELSPEDVLPGEFWNRRDELSHLPLYILCERLYRILGLGAVSGQEAYLFTFFDELQNHLLSNPSDIHTFLRAWDETIRRKPIPASAADGIRILTIHKAKGLQYHTVLLPYMDWYIERNVASDDTIWCRSAQAPFDALGTLPVNSSSDMTKSCFADDYDEEHLQRRVDAINIMYVAFTRAENNLLIWGAASSGKEKLSTAGDLIRCSLDMDREEPDMLLFSSGTPVTAEEKAASTGNAPANRMSPPRTGDNALDIAMVSSPPRLNFMQSNRSRRFMATLGTGGAEAAAQSYLDVGLTMHYVLSQIRHAGDLPKALRRCEAEGLITDRRLLEGIAGRLRRGMAAREVAAWFDPANEVFNECSITCRDPESGTPQTMRPDRVVISGRLVTVVDYKFGRQEEEHVSQVRGYMRQLAGMYPRHEIRGFLWYVYSGTTKEVYL